MSAVIESLVGELLYTSDSPERLGEERGRESFRMDLHPDGSRVISSHAEIDDAPSVVRDVSLRIDAEGQPADCFVRIFVGGAFRGTAWFRLAGALAECEASTTVEGRVSQQMRLDGAAPAFGNHAIVNDGFLLSLYDRTQGPGTQVIKNLPLSSPDHRGATGPMLFAVDLAIQYHGEERIEVKAGQFNALKFTFTDVPGLPIEHPPYNLWCTNDGHFVLLQAEVGGYMQTRYELVRLEHIRHSDAS
jgi:hypothetical protein